MRWCCRGSSRLKLLENGQRLLEGWLVRIAKVLEAEFLVSSNVGDVFLAHHAAAKDGTCDSIGGIEGRKAPEVVDGRGSADVGRHGES